MTSRESTNHAEIEPQGERYRSFHLNHASVGVASADAASLNWLAESLEPSFQVDQQAHVRQRVRLVIDPVGHQLLLDKPPQCRLAVPGFRGRPSSPQLHLWRGKSVDAGCVLFDPNGRVFLQIQPEARAIRLIASDEPARYRQTLSSVIREITCHQAQRLGDVLLRGDACLLANQAVLITGAPETGKTSVLLHALQHGASLVGSQQLLIHSEDGPLTVSGTGAAVALADACLPLFPDLARAWLESGYLYSRTRAESRHQLPDVANCSRQSLVVTAAQMTELLSSGSHRQATIAAVLVPRVLPQAERSRLVLLAPLEAAERIQDARWSLSVEEGQSPLAARQATVPAAHQQHLCRSLAFQVPCFDCQLGRDAFASEASWWTELATNLVGHATLKRRRAA